ncbi:MAG: type II secretion system protein [Phycisphaerae bacterium]
MIIRRHRQDGFTLIELLVVISIISLLLAIVLPAMSASRKRAKRTQCLTRLRELYLAHVGYINSESRFPDLNNVEDDGTFQYNYLIFDGMDFEHNFGPIIQYNGMMEDLRNLYCPVQRDPFHSLSTTSNPWPTVLGLDTRAGYGRRYNVSRSSFSRMRSKAFLSDLMHLPSVIRSAHQLGVNVAYTDGHVKWVQDTGFLTENDLTHPFDIMDNPIVVDIWHELDRND